MFEKREEDGKKHERSASTLDRLINLGDRFSNYCATVLAQERVITEKKVKYKHAPSQGNANCKRRSEPLMDH